MELVQLRLQELSYRDIGQRIGFGREWARRHILGLAGARQVGRWRELSVPQLAELYQRARSSRCAVTSSGCHGSRGCLELGAS
jgi:hypothetical protein